MSTSSSVLSLCLLPALLAAGCSAASPDAQPSAPGPSTTSAPTRPSSGSLSPAPLSLPGGCAADAVSDRLTALARDVSRGDGQAVAAHFLPGPDLRWEVREHFDPPNGTGGALRTPEAIAAFVQVLHQRGEAWTMEQVAPPAQHDDGAPAVYAARITATAPGATLGSPVKVVIDCDTGLVTHMVGPST